MPLLRLSLPLPARLSVMASALVLLASCGGGGGGGGSATSPATAYSVGNGFPLGVSTHSPLALGGSSVALSSASTTVSAVAEGQQSLSGSDISASALFDSGMLTHASCYGPAIAYVNHDDQTGTNGTLSAGDVAIWNSVDSQTSGSPACSVAELDTQLNPMTAQVRQGMLLIAALRRAAATNGTGKLPDPAASVSFSSPMTSLLAPLLPGVTVQSATISATSDASQYTYRLVLRRGTGTNAESLEVVLLHTPNDTSYRFAGVLRVTLSRLTSSTTYGCSDSVDVSTGLYAVAHVTSLGYNRYDDALSTRLRAGHYCGAPSSNSTSHFEDIAAVTESGELDPVIALNNTGARSGIKGWKRELMRYSSDVNLGDFSGDHLHAWQTRPVDGKSRIFLVHSAVTGGTRSALVFHGFGDDFTTSDGTLVGMYCNWGGPGASHTNATAAFQSQSLTLSGGSWNLLSSSLRYAPTNTCAASGTMTFDANGDGVLDSSEGAGTTSGLDVPTGGRSDAQSEVIERGYWAPTLF